jgi:pyruvate/2-oxoglutarate dehydrogenase complex dihydrolipoamide dehydrogenase (E3) component
LVGYSQSLTRWLPQLRDRHERRPQSDARVTPPQGTRPRLGLLADRDRRVLVGAWAVAPLAGEWIHQAALAIRAQIPLETLLDQVAQFPTYSEAYLQALERLPLN